MINFKEDVYMENARLTYETREGIERIADEVSKQGFKNIFFIGSGGSIAIMWPIQYILKTLTTIPVYCEIAAEITLTGNTQLTKDSIVITASKSGDTKETVNAAKYCKEKGIRVISLIGKTNSPLEKYSSFVIPNKALNGVEFEYIQLFMFVFRLLYNNNEFSNYFKFVEQLEILPKNLLAAKQKFDPIAAEIAKKYYNESYQMWIGGGNLWGEVYMFSMCILEEMQWIKTKSVTSSEFFHGSLELIEEDTCVFLVKGEDSTRPLDERVEAFIKRFSKKITIIDTKDYELVGIDDEFRWILCPTISSTLLVDRLARHFEDNTGHDLDLRRYYRTIEY